MIIHLSNNNHFSWDLHHLSETTPRVDEIKQKAQGIKRKLNFTEDEINFIENKTKLQSQESDWSLYRKGRVTASKCKRVASLKPTTSPSKTIKELLANNTPQSAAMLQGLQNEESIAEAFINKLDSEGKKGLSITKCGKPGWHYY